jgi:hypothetical protein
MGKALARLTLAAMAAVLVIGLGASPSRAHNDWGLPLVGGLAGGVGLSYLMNREHQERQPAYAPPPPNYEARPVYAVPVSPAVPPPSAASTAASIENQLNVLDDLAAKGYITKEQYQSRRQALLNQL